MPMSFYFSSRGEVLSSENQVRRAAMARIHFQDEERRCVFESFDRSSHTPLAFILFEDERGRLGRLSPE